MLPRRVADLPPAHVFPASTTPGGGGAVPRASVPMPPRCGVPHDPIGLAHAEVANAAAAFAAAASGNALATLDAVLCGLQHRPDPYVLNQIRFLCDFTRWCAAGCAPRAEHLGAHAMTRTSAGLLETLIGLFAAERRSVPLAPTYDFYGSPVMPFAAIHYWIAGDGRTRRVHIDALNLHLTAERLAPISQRLHDASLGPGVHRIDAPFTYDLFRHGLRDIWAAGTLGRGSGRVRGELTLTADGHYRFLGHYMMDRDRYDANPGTRPWIKEGLTAVLRGLGERFGHTDYDIEVVGEKALDLSGRR